MKLEKKKRDQACKSTCRTTRPLTLAEVLTPVIPRPVQSARRRPGFPVKLGDTSGQRAAVRAVGAAAVASGRAARDPLPVARVAVPVATVVVVEHHRRELHLVVVEPHVRRFVGAAAAPARPGLAVADETRRTFEGCQRRA